MDSAYAWKQYYRAERERLGRPALLEFLDRAEPLDVSDGAAVVVPHTRLEVTGSQIARAVATVVASGADRVLALGVLHGARRVDRDRVAAARATDMTARDELRGVHTEDDLAAEEFSLDAFVELLDLAAERAGRTIEVLRRYPFLVGDDPASLPGLDELRSFVDGGSMLVVTTDPIHHGHVYGTSPDECLDADDAETVSTAWAMIDQQLSALSDHRFTEFAALVEQHRSDFRDTGPAMAMLVGAGFDHEIHDLALVDYAEPLDAASPTWVAGALATV